MINRDNIYGYKDLLILLKEKTWIWWKLIYNGLYWGIRTKLDNVNFGVYE